MKLSGKLFAWLAVIVANMWLFERLGWLGLVAGAVALFFVLGLDWALIRGNTSEGAGLRKDGRTEHQFRNALFPIHASLRLT